MRPEKILYLFLPFIYLAMRRVVPGRSIAMTNSGVSELQFGSIVYELPSEKGLYIIGFHVQSFSTFIAGKQRFFNDGYIIYVGSAGNGFNKRVLRHLTSKRKKWHIDYISQAIASMPSFICLVKGGFGVELEDRLASRLAHLFTPIGMLGSSDANEPHLFYTNDMEMILEFLYGCKCDLFIFPSFYDSRNIVSLNFR